MKITELSQTELQELHAELEARYQDLKGAGWKLDLTRGKPSTEQLELSNELDGILDGFYLLQDGTDVRNYGGLLGIPEARQLGAEFLGVAVEEVMVGGNSSLTLMHQYVTHAHLHGVAGPGSSWQAEAVESGGTVKFLCPVPGYDRHFTVCEQLGIEMMTVPMLATGPDMDQVEELVRSDPLIKGIWCVPKYSNPTGVTFSDDTVRRMAGLARFAGANFRIMWDNAYAVHDLEESSPELLNIMAECRSLGTADSVILLGSTSKITFAGAGIAFFGASTANLSAFEKFLAVASIGHDKVNQLRHLKFLPDMAGVRAHMAKHRAILKPKFDTVLRHLDNHLAGKDVGTWSRPEGGYFVSFDALPGQARDIIALAEAAGVKLTPAGATFPYGEDPDNANIRLAPTFPSQEDLEKAMEVFVVCVQLSAVNTQLG